MSEKKTTILQKLGGILLGALALLGALMLVNWGYQRMTGPASVVGSSAQVAEAEADSVAAEQAAKGAGLAAPCTAAALPVVGCGCPQNTDAGRGDLFPGSYVAFAYTNAGCEVDPRNKRC